MVRLNRLVGRPRHPLNRGDLLFARRRRARTPRLSRSCVLWRLWRRLLVHPGKRVVVLGWPIRPVLSVVPRPKRRPLCLCLFGRDLRLHTLDRRQVLGGTLRLFRQVAAHRPGFLPQRFVLAHCAFGIERLIGCRYWYWLRSGRRPRCRWCRLSRRCWWCCRPLWSRTPRWRSGLVVVVAPLFECRHADVDGVTQSACLTSRGRHADGVRHHHAAHVVRCGVSDFREGVHPTILVDQLHRRLADSGEAVGIVRYLHKRHRDRFQPALMGERKQSGVEHHFAAVALNEELRSEFAVHYRASLLSTSKS